ncbi:hypothetical protein AAZX31_10G175700 [Glycine max]|nr:hypothetical protein GLYMA_10G185900v4 [Glycine max]KAH1138955.1 hypothetical protein GYH30_028416 [Glycine max]
MEVFKILIFNKDVPQPLYCGATKTMVDITVLKRKHVYLLISSLDITEEEISVFQTVYDSIKTSDQYEIVWIPIVEEWTVEYDNKFEDFKCKMPWYAVQHSGPIAGYQYIKEEWHYKSKPMVVVLSPQGKVQHSNAFHLIQAHGTRAFPFTTVKQEQINNETDWVGSVIGNIYPIINTWIKEKKYIFLYGGKDKEWIQQFTKNVSALASDAAITEANISIEWLCVEKEDRSVMRRFWGGIESLFVTKVHKAVDAVTLEVQKMLSYKNEAGWSLLISEGSSVVVCGHGKTITDTVEGFQNWKGSLTKKGFGLSFQGYHQKIVDITHRCSYLEISNVSGRLPETIKCPDCPRIMEIFVSYKCCHNNTIHY